MQPLVKLANSSSKELVAEVEAARAEFRNLMDLPAASLVPASMYREGRLHHGD